MPPLALPPEPEDAILGSLSGDAFSRAAAEGIRLPTLLVHGANTQPSFVAIIDALEGCIRGAQRVVIPDAGHGMSSDNPEDFNRAVLSFLEGR